MVIKHKKLDNKGVFFYQLDKNILAEMTYVFAGDNKIIIDHTEVDNSLRGKGVGYQMVEAAVVFARDKHLKIMPLCPFAKAVFDKTKNYNDVLF